ncbi:MAG TPA: Rrf2 family transcriptional regulator [Flavitalea sp.]|nr:Rrf2 family transcriptional regulator [Flavitalea sp.]
MSMLSVTCTTAIKAVVYLGKLRDGEKAGILEIAEAIEASEHTVGKMLQTLVKSQVICSQKGPTGGFYVTSRQKNQPIIQIIVAIDGREVFDKCGLGLSKCASTHPCPIHKEYKVVRDDFKSLCQRNRISQLCETVDEGLCYLVG